MRILLIAIFSFFWVCTTFASDTLFAKYKRFIAKPEAAKNLKTLQIVGVIVQNNNDSLEFVLHKVFPDTLRLQVRFGDTYAVTVITSQTGWIVDPMRQIIEPKELLPDELRRVKSNILNLFAFIDPCIWDSVNSWDVYNPDTNYISFALINSTQDSIVYVFNKKDFSDNYRLLRFYHSPYLFKLMPKNFFSYMGFSIPRQIEVYVNDLKKTLMYIVNININGEIDRDLFRLKK